MLSSSNMPDIRCSSVFIRLLRSVELWPMESELVASLDVEILRRYFSKMSSVSVSPFALEMNMELLTIPFVVFSLSKGATV